MRQPLSVRPHSIQPPDTLILLVRRHDRKFSSGPETSDHRAGKEAFFIPAFEILPADLRETGSAAQEAVFDGVRDTAQSFFQRRIVGKKGSVETEVVIHDLRVTMLYIDRLRSPSYTGYSRHDDPQPRVLQINGQFVFFNPGLL